MLSRLKARTSEHEQAELNSISESEAFTATLLPIKTVGVQVCTMMDICNTEHGILSQTHGY